MTMIKQQANENLNAKVDFSDVDLSVFKSFPDLYVSINDLKVQGIDSFAGVNLADIKTFNVGINILSVFSDQIKIKTIVLDEPNLYVKILKSGKANYDITKPSTEPEKASTEPSKPFKMNLKKYEVKNGRIMYDDASMDLVLELKSFNHTGKGDFTEDVFTLETVSVADTLYFAYEGVPYLNKVYLKGTCDLEMDMAKSLYTFKQNEFLLNDLPLKFDGSIGLPNETDITMDLKLEAVKSDFKSILSLIPAVYTKDFSTVQTSGKFDFKGSVKGTYNDTKMPSFHVHLNVENITVKLAIDNPDGVDDHTVVNLEKLHLEMAGNPVDAHMITRTPISDPQIDGAMKARLDLGNIQKIMPLSAGDQYAGIIDADVSVKGKMSDVEKEQYENFHAAGNVRLENFMYVTKDMPKTTIQRAHLMFTPKHLELTEMQMTTGNSDFSLKGYVSNYIAYYLKDEPLKAELTHSSNLINVNDWMDPSKPATTASTTDSAAAPLSIIEVPANIDFKFTSSVGKIIYETKELTNVKGLLTIANQEIKFHQLRADMLGGAIDLSGLYNTQNKLKPMVNFKWTFKNLICL